MLEQVPLIFRMCAQPFESSPTYGIGVSDHLYRDVGVVKFASMIREGPRPCTPTRLSCFERPRSDEKIR